TYSGRSYGRTQLDVAMTTSARQNTTNIIIRFITVLLQRVVVGEIYVESAEPESRGSPFPMPARSTNGLNQGDYLKNNCSPLFALIPVGCSRLSVSPNRDRGSRAVPQEGGPASAAMCLR